MKRKLVVDGQIFQTPAWHRGMGKYSLELLETISDSLDKSRWGSIDIILSKHAPPEDSRVDELRAKLPAVKVVPLGLARNDFRNDKIAEKNRKVIDNYVRKLDAPPDRTDYLILSLMQGEIFPVFPSDSGIHTSLLFYDLIPLMFHDLYLNSPVTRATYLPKIHEALKADLYFSISKTVANDLALYLGIDKAKIVNIDGGPINHGDVPRPIEVPRPFILMPTGNDLRKNNRRGVLGFREFNKLHNDKYSLVITSFFSEEEKKELRTLTDKVYFSGNVHGEELSYLYEKCEGVLFPSVYEGLGLPILEAVENNKPVACSNIAVFHEMSEDAFRFFEPKSTLEIERALNALVTSPEVDAKAYAEILRKYRWKNTASSFEQAMSMPSFAPVSRDKPAIAIFGPDPAANDTAGKLMQFGYAGLSRLFKIHFYVSGTKSDTSRRLNYLPYVADSDRLSPGLAFSSDNYGSVLYNLSNDESCADVLLAALAKPGILILHDMSLDKVWQELSRRQLVSAQRYNLEKHIDEAYRVDGISFLASAIQGQAGAIVFSAYHAALLGKLAHKAYPSLRIFSLKTPLGNIVYPEAIPSKTIEIGEMYQHELASDNSKINVRTDFEYNEALSKMRTIILDSDVTQYDVIEAMRFGAVPFVPTTSMLAGSKNKLVEGYDSVEEARKSAKKIVLDNHRYAALSKKTALSVQDQSIQEFAEKIQLVIKDVS